MAHSFLTLLASEVLVDDGLSGDDDGSVEAASLFGHVEVGLLPAECLAVVGVDVLDALSFQYGEKDEL